MWTLAKQKPVLWALCIEKDLFKIVKLLSMLVFFASSKKNLYDMKGMGKIERLRALERQSLKRTVSLLQTSPSMPETK